MRVLFSVLTLVSFLFTGILGPMPIYAQDGFYLPAPGAMVHLSPAFDPPMLKGIKVHSDDPLRLDFILDQGDVVGAINNRPYLKEEATKLIKYFLTSLTVPENDLWVNLSPYEKDRVIPQSFGLTEMGRDLLAEDYMLKQITASLIYPEDAIGKKFWKRIYEEAVKKYGTTNIPVNTFNKVWIVPDKAIVYENAKVGTAYVIESKLKVMLEEDYLSMEKHKVETPFMASHNGDAINRVSTNNVNALGSQIVREIVIPELTKEVNENKNFAPLRQVYNSLILADWYKKKIKESILTQVYDDKNKITGIQYASNVNETQLIYQRYLSAFKKGVYNYIKEEVVIDPESKKQEILPRKYFSGGLDFKNTTEQDVKQLPTVAAMSTRDLFASIILSPARAFVEGATGTPPKNTGFHSRNMTRRVFSGTAIGLTLLAGSGLLKSAAQENPPNNLIESPPFTELKKRFENAINEAYKAEIFKTPDRDAKIQVVQKLFDEWLGNYFKEELIDLNEKKQEFREIFDIAEQRGYILLIDEGDTGEKEENIKRGGIIAYVTGNTGGFPTVEIKSKSKPLQQEQSLRMVGNSLNDYSFNWYIPKSKEAGVEKGILCNVRAEPEAFYDIALLMVKEVMDSNVLTSKYEQLNKILFNYITNFSKYPKYSGIKFKTIMYLILKIGLMFNPKGIKDIHEGSYILTPTAQIVRVEKMERNVPHVRFLDKHYKARSFGQTVFLGPPMVYLDFVEKVLNRDTNVIVPEKFKALHNQLEKIVESFNIKTAEKIEYNTETHEQSHYDRWMKIFESLYPNTELSKLTFQGFSAIVDEFYKTPDLDEILGRLREMATSINEKRENDIWLSLDELTAPNETVGTISRDEENFEFIFALLSLPKGDGIYNVINDLLSKKHSETLIKLFRGDPETIKRLFTQGIYSKDIGDYWLGVAKDGKIPPDLLTRIPKAYDLLYNVWDFLHQVNTKGNRAMETKKQRKLGGIDLTSANMNLQTQNAGDEGIRFHIDPAVLAQLQNAIGFTPEITSFQPLKDLRIFLDDKNEISAKG